MKDGNADMIKGQVCLDEMKSGGNKGPKAVLRLKVRSGGRERGLCFQFGARSAIIGAEFGRHLWNVGLDILARLRGAEILKISIILGVLEDSNFMLTDLRE
jgi:hypothetical protein